jgi:hypothetical protein
LDQQRVTRAVVLAALKHSVAVLEMPVLKAPAIWSPPQIGHMWAKVEVGIR